MKSLQDEWKVYRDACYPKGCLADQNKECHQAFMAGAACALLQLSENVNKETPDVIANWIHDNLRQCEELFTRRGIELSQNRN